MVNESAPTDPGVPWNPAHSLGTRKCLVRLELAANPLRKRGHRRGGAGQPDYRFVGWDDIAKQVGETFARHGIDISASVEESSNEPATTPGGKPTNRWRTRVKIVLRAADNPIDAEWCEWDGVTDDGEATGQSKATTYAVKDWLLKSFLLAGDESDIGGQAPGDAAAVMGSDEVPGCPRCGKPLRELHWKDGPHVGCSGWKSNGSGCDFKAPGSLTEYISKLREASSADAPSGEFTEGPDGPVELTKAQADEMARLKDEQAATSKAWMTDQHREMMRLFRDLGAGPDARNAILSAGGAVMLGQKDGKWTWKEAGLKAASAKMLTAAITALQELPMPDQVEPVQNDLL